MADTTPSPSSGTRPPGGRPGKHREQHRGEPAAGDALAHARNLGTELIGAVRDSAAALLDEQRTRAANEIATLGEVLHRSVQSLNRTGGENVVRYTDDAARQISQFADRLHRCSLTELTGDIEDFARRWPIAFIAAAIGVGLLAGRLLASSASRPAEQNPAQQNPAEQNPTQTAASYPASGGAEPPGDTRPGDTGHDDRAVGEFASGRRLYAPERGSR